jgi:type IV secretion system protein VirB10
LFVSQQESPKQKPIESPSGIDLRPQIPPSVRVSKRAGFVAISALAGVGALFGYGVYERHAKQMQATLRADSVENVQPAESAADEITKNIPAGPVTVSRNPGKRTDVPDLNNPGKKSGSPKTANRQAATQSASPRRVATSRPESVQPVSTVQEAEEPTPEQKRLAAAYERELQAIAAPTTIQTGSAMQGNVASPTGTAVPPSSPNPSIDDVQGFLRKISGSGNSSAGTSATAGATYDRQNAQSDKDRFLAQARGSKADDYLNSTRTTPISRYEIKAGWDIPAVLEQALNSDLPGEIRALVAENVYDTATGRYLLIPQGSRLVGTYDSHIGYGQNGVQIVWNRIIFPDASAIDLNGMVGQDASGAAGLRGKVDSHLKRLVGYSILSTVLTAGFELSQNRSNRGILQYPSIGDTAEGAVGSELGRVGSQLTERQLNIQPTIKVPVGFKFNVRVNRDILFDQPFWDQR